MSQRENAPVKILRHERSTRATERFLCRLGSDSFGPETLDDDERAVKRVALEE
jgi:hypothetical protein